MQKLLQHYADTIKQGSFTLPVAALECLQRLRTLGPLALLSSDRGFTVAEKMAVYPSHPHALHEGCFSHMVNFHALSLSFRTALMTQRELLDGVQTCFFGDFECGPQLRYAFEEQFARANALNHTNEFFAIFRNKSQLRTLLGFVRLSLNDGNALAAVGRQISTYLRDFSYGERQELIQMLEDVWNNDYYFRGAPNVTFWLAHLYEHLGIYDRALWFYEKTAERQGVDAMLLVFQASCLRAMDQRVPAQQRYLQALDLVPGMREASDGLRSLKIT